MVEHCNDGVNKFTIVFVCIVLNHRYSSKGFDNPVIMKFIERKKQ